MQSNKCRIPHREMFCRRVRSAVLESLEGRQLLSAMEPLDTDPTDAPVLYAVQAAAAKPVVTITAPNNTPAEAKQRKGWFVVSRTGSTAAPLTVQLTISGTAKNGVDYNKIESSVVIPANAESAKIVIVPIDDTRIEKPESVRIALAANSAYKLGTPSEASMNIADNDGPVVQVSATDPQGNEIGQDNIAFQFTRSGVLSQPVTISFNLSGTAKNGRDYVAITRTITIPASQTSATLDIDVIDDLHAEAQETVTVEIKTGLYRIGKKNSASAAITDNDTNEAESKFVVFMGPPGDGIPGSAFYVPARGGAIPSSVSNALTEMGFSGTDEAINISPDGQWILLHTDRFGGVTGQASLAILPVSAIYQGAQVRIGGELIVAVGEVSAVGNGGTLVVYCSEDGPHALDLWAATLEEGVWSTTLITEDSDYDYNMHPALSADCTKVVFAAGNGPDESDCEAIAEVGIDGLDYQVLVSRAYVPPDGNPDAYLNHPDYAPDGSVVFASNWLGQQLWRWTPGAGDPAVINAANTGETVCTVLSDGKLVSLWNGRVGSGGAFELTIRYADGSYVSTILPTVDLPHGGLGSGA